MCDYKQQIYTSDDKVKIRKHFEFLTLLLRYEDNITVSNKLKKQLVRGTLSCDDYIILNDVMDSVVYILNLTNKFNAENYANLSRYYIISYTYALPFTKVLTYKLIPQYLFEKCNIF